MRAFLISILASAVIAIVYALLIGQREEQIRAYLKNTADGWLRRLYVTALIQAVRGRADEADSRHLALIIVFLLLGVAFGLREQTGTVERRWSQIGVRVDRLSRDVEHPPTSEEIDRRLAQELREIIELRRAVDADLRWVLPVMKATSVVFFAAYSVALFFWMPYVLLRRRFAHEIARFSLRIQGLASQEELARLTEAELDVKDPKTLRAYVDVMKEVASRQGVPELTKTFELWQG